jgi:RNA polymerase sigma-70 factor, ECF subfamily
MSASGRHRDHVVLQSHGGAGQSGGHTAASDRTTGTVNRPIRFRGVVRHSLPSADPQINAYVGDLAEAQDLVQEAFTRAIARWDKIARYDDPASWVRKVAWHLATSRWRRQRTASAFLHRQREVHITGPSPDRVALTAALATLQPTLRKAFVLHYIAQLSIVVGQSYCRRVCRRARRGFARLRLYQRR